MKLPQISMIIGLAVLLNFSIPTTWANKKTAIIAGSAGGGAAAAAIGGTLWYKLRNYNKKMRYYFDKELLEIKSNDLAGLTDALESKGIKSPITARLKSKVDNRLSDEETGKVVDVFIEDGNDGKLYFLIKSGNRLIGMADFVKKELNSSTEANETRVIPNNLEKINSDSNIDDSLANNDSGPYTSSMDMIDDVSELSFETMNLLNDLENMG